MPASLPLPLPALHDGRLPIVHRVLHIRRAHYCRTTSVLQHYPLRYHNRSPLMTYTPVGHSILHIRRAYYCRTNVVGRRTLSINTTFILLLHRFIDTTPHKNSMCNRRNDLYGKLASDILNCNCFSVLIIMSGVRCLLIFLKLFVGKQDRR